MGGPSPGSATAADPTPRGVVALPFCLMGVTGLCSHKITLFQASDHQCGFSAVSILLFFGHEWLDHEACSCLCSVPVSKGLWSFRVIPCNKLLLKDTDVWRGALGIIHSLFHGAPAFHNNSVCAWYLSLNSTDRFRSQAPPRYLILGLLA